MMTNSKYGKFSWNYKNLAMECWRKFDSTPAVPQCQVLCEWSTDWPHDISLGPAESNSKNAGRVVTDGVMRMWSLKLPVDLTSHVLFAITGGFLNITLRRNQSNRSQTWCQVLFFTIRAPYLPWVPCPAGWNFVHGYPFFYCLVD